MSSTPDLSLVLSAAGAGTGKKFQKLSLPQNVELIKTRVNWSIKPTGVIKVVAPTKIMIQGSPFDDNSSAPSGVATPVNGDGAVVPAVLAVGSTPEKVAFGAFPYKINGANYNKAADAVGVVFSAAHKVAISKFGAIAININAAGDINTQINSAAQTDTLDHDTALFALQKVQQPEFLPPTNHIRIGYILIANDGDLWTANTDDLTDGSDVTTATFFDLTSAYHEIDTYTFDSDDFLRGKGTFFLTETKPNKYVRLALPEFTGDGEITIEADFLSNNSA
jgi:hypothetical protein